MTDHRTKPQPKNVKGRWKSGNRRTLKSADLARYMEPAGFFQGALVNRQAANKAELQARRAAVTGVKSHRSPQEDHND